MMGGFVPGAIAEPPQAAKARSLYAQLGGYDALAAATDDSITSLATDPTLSKFFTGLNDDSKKRVRQHVIDFLCNATGGPCLYLGRDMKTTHKRLHVTEAEWNASAQHLVEYAEQVQSAASAADGRNGYNQRVERGYRGAVKRSCQ